MTPFLPNPATAHAVLIGISGYQRLAELPAVANNLSALAAALQDPLLWGLPPQNCTIVADPGSVDEVLEAVHSAAGSAQSALLVYFAGHGLTDETGELLLGLADSNAERLHRTVRFADIRREVTVTARGCRAKVVILDCCFSGRAMSGFMADPDQFVIRAAVDGAYLMTATSETALALAPPGARYTAFTGALLGTLHNGIPGGPAVLDLDTLFKQVETEMRAAGLPRPHRRSRDSGHLIGLVRNRAAASPRPSEVAETVRRWTPRPLTDVAVRLDQVSVNGYGVPRVAEVTTTIWQGELVAVMGPSGSGKSTLIQAILGGINLDEGTIGFGPTNESRTLAQRRSTLSYVPIGVAVYWSLTVQETLQYATRLRTTGLSRSGIGERVESVLDRLGLSGSHLAVRRVATLSGGQMMGVSIGAEAAGGRDIILLDEPTSGLDPGRARFILAGLRRLCDVDNRTVIIITNSVQDLDYADRVLVMARGGRMVYDGEPVKALTALHKPSWSDLMADLAQHEFRPATSPARFRRSWPDQSLRGFAVLLERQLTVTRRKARSMGGWLLTAPVIIAVALAASTTPAAGLAVLLAASAFAGTSLGYIEFAPELNILQRDWRAGINALPIVLAKLAVMAGLCAIQAVPVAFVAQGLWPFGGQAASLPIWLLMLVIFLVTLASAVTTLLIVAGLYHRQSRTLAWAAGYVTLQAVFSGLYIPSGWLYYFTAVVPVRIGRAAIDGPAGIDVWIQFLPLVGLILISTWAAAIRLERAWAH
jgi:ABC-type multidrug transport system ATPase subunit